MTKLKVAVLFGGVSTEHEISIVSAKSIMQNMDKEKYEVIPIGITKEGKWLLYTGKIEDLDSKWTQFSIECFVSPDRTKKALVKVKDNEATFIDIDVVFPVLHGLNGEDGTVQGLLELSGIPYVGCGVLSSAICMDKAFAKKLALLEGIPQGHFLVVYKNEYSAKKDYFIRRIESEFSYPVFVKPANSGSSVGISKAKDREDLVLAIHEAFLYDTKILIEQAINAREIECAVLGNDEVFVSEPGEIIPSREFYSYEAKYIDNSSELIIPARLPKEVTEEIKDLAGRIYKIFECCGMARVDFFVDKDTNKVYFNEVNTIPGFTSISMYPKLMEFSGIPYSQLIDKLISLAIEKNRQKKSIKYSKEG
ncbi:D-alanine-D-alanine ligase [Caldicellulosiruptor bescii]|uniref:D-alanine--D-alanine ligase n=2 Tax=Caldicellulosiruptor bescii TaxID=31899 RepID=DDL_CALBD|nr:D-alanine--D-alanine ligase family protein [Caldicellulosiruptor bescii]B9MLC6.1 RecName: Full=D-alanine--D-alanine ligase; AltName: Full=D-Ala-D-Ala ligase; AltName: Full=D-alanylalanine synthetase [Caldicellulosiruptor bescii DSM 6725]ACM61116.1 D-alanine/D-alanine ligase [Caldicellulosiruptor bescii DSM 6725]PBC89071.1 D-alanine-D-alanine ligase [Caldicellulosiruptor bescii]PBC91447.1 D-alanine-D-alanine ligase [Caldicellulosiruptor bescii]PBD03142.1 D-alanine-D-alanine ligase [Caldicell